MKCIAFCVFILLFVSCIKPEQEVVYTKYTLKQLKQYLKGKWVISKKQEEDRYFWRFQFRGDTYGSFQDYQLDKGISYVLTDAPGFLISEKDGAFWIEFNAMLSKEPSKYKIDTISNKRLILTQGNLREVYQKMESKLP